ncbi:MAG: acetate--CoA ligase family protein [Pseudooceanicola sp.]
MTTQAARAPYSMDDLRPLYAPRSIAVIGASPRPGSFGGRTVENLSGFDGALYPVNQKYEEVGGVRCYPSLAALPEVPDLAVLTTPAASVEALLEDCIAAGVPAVMVYASGFSEVGTEEGIAAQNRIAARARAAGIRLLGPNCLGVLNYRSGALVSFAGPPVGQFGPGPAIGLVSQSGALGFALAQAMERGVAFSHVVTAGNSADVDVADWVSALAEEPECSAIACVFEGLADPLKFLRAAEVAQARGKPLIVCKIATGEEGAAAAMSHTASLAGSAELWKALFDRAGAVSVDAFEDVIETAWFFAKAPAPKAAGVAALSGSGGAAIMTADAAELAGVPMPQPTPEVVARLRDLIPPYVPARNPCDVTAGVINDMDTLIDSADALLGDPHYGTLIYCYTLAYDAAKLRQPRLSALAEKHGKPVIYAWVTQILEGAGTMEAERDPNIAVFRTMQRAFETIRAWTESAARQALPPAEPETGDDDTRARVRAILDRAEGTALGEGASKAILAAYGIDTPREMRVTDADGAARAATEIGGRLALKVDSPDIPHKSDAGGVVLGVEGAEAAAAAFDRIMRDCRAHAPAARIDGVLVQEMVPQGLEILAGFRHAEGFGPVLTVGLGGVLTEVMRDSATALAPVSAGQAEAMLRGLRGARLFDGFRGAPPVPVAKLAEAVAALSRIAVDFGGELSEFDVNPLICLPDRIVAVDGLAIRKPPA